MFAEAQSEAILLRKFQEERVEIWNFSQAEKDDGFYIAYKIWVPMYSS